MARYQIKDGTRVTLDSATLRRLFDRESASDMRIILSEEIRRQEVQAFMEEEDAEEPCRYKDTCIGACDWCESHDYSDACVPMLQERLRHITKELDFIGAILQTIKEKEEHANH